MARGNRKPGRYANGALISSAKADMQTKQQIEIRQNADKLAADLKKKGIKKPPGTEAGHNANGPGKHGWESIAKNRAVETKNKNKRKLRITNHG